MGRKKGVAYSSAYKREVLKNHMIQYCTEVDTHIVENPELVATTWLNPANNFMSDESVDTLFRLCSSKTQPVAWIVLEWFFDDEEAVKKKIRGN